MAKRTPLEEALAFFDDAEKKTRPQIPKGFFPASVYARGKCHPSNMRRKLRRLVELGEMEAIPGRYGPLNVVTTFFGPKR